MYIRICDYHAIYRNFVTMRDLYSFLDGRDKISYYVHIYVAFTVNYLLTSSHVIVHFSIDTYGLSYRVNKNISITHSTITLSNKIKLLF